MAKSKNLFRVNGTIGDYTFYTYRGKQYIRRKSSLNAERVKKDDAFEPSRKAGAIFGRASRASKSFRNSISPFDKALGDGTYHNRLSKAIAGLLRAHPDKHPEGTINWAELAPHIAKVEFNTKAHFHQVVNVQHEFCISPDRQMLYSDFSVPNDFIFSRAQSSTHFRFHLVLAPIAENAKPRKYKPGTDLSLEATWSSPWFPSDAPMRMAEPLDVPQFMLQNESIVFLLVVEPGAQFGKQIEPTHNSLAIKLLNIF